MRKTRISPRRTKIENFICAKCERRSSPRARPILCGRKIRQTWFFGNTFLHPHLHNGSGHWYPAHTAQWHWHRVSACGRVRPGHADRARLLRARHAVPELHPRQQRVPVRRRVQRRAHGHPRAALLQRRGLPHALPRAHRGAPARGRARGRGGAQTAAGRAARARLRRLPGRDDRESPEQMRALMAEFGFSGTGTCTMNTNKPQQATDALCVEGRWMEFIGASIDEFMQVAPPARTSKRGRAAELAGSSKRAAIDSARTLAEMYGEFDRVCAEANEPTAADDADAVLPVADILAEIAATDLGRPVSEDSDDADAPADADVGVIVPDVFDTSCPLGDDADDAHWFAPEILDALCPLGDADDGPGSIAPEILDALCPLGDCAYDTHWFAPGSPQVEMYGF